eukprot:1159036-Pelagomonas_calceolata.AAC.4
MPNAHAQAMDEPSERDKFQGLLEPMLACLGTTLNAGDESSAQEALEMLIEGRLWDDKVLREGMCKRATDVGMQVIRSAGKRHWRCS